MLFERLPESVDALDSRNNTPRNLAAFHFAREFRKVPQCVLAGTQCIDRFWQTLEEHVPSHSLHSKEGTQTGLWFRHGNTNGIMVWARMLWSPPRMLLEREQDYGFGMDAVVTVCSWNTNGLMVWAWMHRLPYALGTRTGLWFGHGCTGYRMLLEREQDYGLGMDELVTVCSWNANGITVWAWMHRLPYALGTRTGLWFGHGCSGQRMLLEHEWDYGLGMYALATVCSWNRNAPPPNPAPEMAETTENTMQTVYTPPPTTPIRIIFSQLGACPGIF